VTARARAVALFCAAAVSVSPAFAQFAPTAPAVTPSILSVPYLPQTEALCGGAAAAMVMRYWGAQDLYPDAFAPLVDRSAGGIRTSALVGALEARNWTAVAGPGDGEQMARELARGRPVIALIEDRPGRYHYVVVVGSAAGKVVLHDPARAPSRVVDVAKFDAAWQRSQRWMLILLPPDPGSGLGLSPGAKRRPDPGSDGKRRPDPEPVEPCAGPVEDAVALAQRGDKAAARRALEATAGSCPEASAPWRELAGLDVLDQNWTAAAEHARRATAINPGDSYAWQLLATAEYVRHDDLAALAAWNHVGEPRADLIDIEGLEHTRYRVIAGAIGVGPRQLLTPDALRLAERRVRAVPAIAFARVTFRPGENGKATIDAAVVERNQAPTAYASWIGTGLRAATDRELGTSFSNVSGGGDVVTASWRWWEHRPRVAASYAAPGPGGIWRLDVSRETQTFGVTAPLRFEETRTRAGVEIGNWIDQRTRVIGGAAIEGWSDRPRTASVSGRVEFWPVVDRLALEAGAATWRGAGGSFGGADAAARWQSKASLAGTVWRIDTGYRAATAASPTSLWPGADTGHARDVLLRAHPLLDDGIIGDGAFGRRLAFGTLEVQRWLKPSARPVRVAPAAFVDIAHASRGLPSSIDRTQVDAGAGIRLSLPGTSVLRIDLAHGLRDGHTAVSVGWQR
jgi:Papain-like cysteine protease AvrRpt2